LGLFAAYVGDDVYSDTIAGSAAIWMLDEDSIRNIVHGCPAIHLLYKRKIQMNHPGKEKIKMNVTSTPLPPLHHYHHHLHHHYTHYQ